MCCSKPTAKISKNKLVLSLPDAMTPVVWMMDISDKSSFVLKVDQNENGQFIVQKISLDGKKIEDIAYYASKKKAVRAMTVISKVMEDGSGDKRLNFWRIMFVISATMAVLLFADYLYFTLSGGDGFLPTPEPQISETLPTPQQTQAQIQPQAPIVTNDTDSIGVPMSADDFLKEQDSMTFPF